MRLKLKITADAKSTVRDFESKATILLGRTGADIQIGDKACSRQHGLFFESPDHKLWLKDLKSTNGTKVNGKKVSDVEICIGDVVQVGAVLLEVVKFEASEKSASITTPEHAPKDHAPKKESFTTADDAVILKGWPDNFRAIQGEKVGEFIDYIDEQGRRSSVRLSEFLKMRSKG